MVSVLETLQFYFCSVSGKILKGILKETIYIPASHYLGIYVFHYF